MDLCINTRGPWRVIFPLSEFVLVAINDSFPFSSRLTTILNRRWHFIGVGLISNVMWDALSALNASTLSQQNSTKLQRPLDLMLQSKNTFKDLVSFQRLFRA